MSTQPPPPPPPPSGGWQQPGWQQPAWQPPPPIDRSRIRPSKLWYWVGGAIALVSVAASIVLFVLLFESFLGTDFEDFDSTETVRVELEEGDERMVYSRPDLGAVSRSELGCVASGPGGDGALSPATSPHIEINGRDYEGLFEFRAEGTGTYQVRCAADRPVPLAVGPKVNIGTFLGELFGALALFFIGPMAGIAIVVVVAVLRNRSKRRLEEEAREAGASGAMPAPPLS